MERVFFLFLLFVAYSSSRSIPFRSVKSPDEIIHNYELVNLEISSRSSNRRLEEHPSTLSVSVKQGSIQLFALQLELNKNLIAPHFASVYTNSDGIQVSETHPNCFYHGIVNGHPKWQAVISTCHGLRGWFGDLNNENYLYHLEPLTDDHLRANPEKDTLANTHVLYKDTENKKKLQNAVCGTPHGNVSADRFKLPSEGGSSLHRMRRQSGGASNIVELLIVNDNNQYIAYGRNISAVVLRAIEIFSHVDMLYQSINVRVVIVYSLTWTARQEITFSSVPNTLLTLFRQYHSSTAAFRSITHDSAQLITGIDLDGNTVGIAFVGTMCNFDSSVGLTQDTRGSVASVATIAAHEMGHTFGMDHDDDSSCNCPDSNSGCIMNAVSRWPPATRWSQCSINELNAGFARSGSADLNRCLGNSPTTIVGTARCGNGIREPGETCDCGSLAECNDPCCNATTCELASTAQCASGVCCENCRFKSYGTTCRNSSGMCDILEYCTGLNADCPTDVTRQNGVPCASNNAYCYDGTCGSTRDQCIRYFGSVSVPSNDVCYTQLNTLGVGWGHCGADGTNYIPCTTGNASCGSLQCNGGSIIFNNVNSRSALTTYTRFASNQECRSVTTRADADEVSPGLVVDGASCGTNRMCVNQRCSLITSLEGVSPCPIGSNGQTCSGNGVCNNLNQCSCNVGYTGSDCSQILGTTPTPGPTSKFLPFLYPSSYNVYTNVDDGSATVTLPTTLEFGGFHYNRAYISSNGLVSFGSAYNSYSPKNFPLQNGLAVMAPYWDDSRLSGSRQLRYQIVSGSSSLITEVNAFLSNYTGDTFEADWLLWAYWHDICPFNRGNCQDSNFFQVAIAVQRSVTYSIFTYQCGLIRWTLRPAAVGYSVNGAFYDNYQSSRSSSVVNIDCEGAVSMWTNVVYRIGTATNTPPVIEASDTFMITVGETALYTLRITDPGDTISVTIDGEFPYTVDRNGSIWTLNVTLTTLVEFNFTVIATDSFNEISKITPQVIICSCTSDRGNCTIDEYENNTSNPLILMCDCIEAYEGEYCEDDFDGCTEVSCFNDATCTDVPAPGTGATCPPCPSGYTGDGIVCSTGPTSKFLPFLYPSSYNVYTNVDDGSATVTLPTTLKFGGFHYNRAYISSNGLVSFGSAYNSFSPKNFPLQNSLAVVAPYWDDSRLSGSKQLRYQIVSGSSSLITEVNAFLSNYTGDTFEADWLLWAYWHDICPYNRGNCQDSNFFQVAIAVQRSVTYSIFTYQCGLIRWTLRPAAVGYSVNGAFYENHQLSRSSSVVNIDCEGAVSMWTNVVYRIGNC